MRLLRRWVPTVGPVVLLAILALLPLGVAAAYGATGLARNDDWSYQQILGHWVTTGDLSLNGWVSMFLVGQLVLAYPVTAIFPDNVLALQVFVTILGAIGVVAAYLTVRRFTRTSYAVLAVALLVIGPLYAPLSVSFMTDVPAFAAQAVCLACGAAALDADTGSRRRILLAIASLVIGFAGATIREYALVAPAAVTMIVLLQSVGRRDRRVTLLVSIGGTAGLISFGGAFAIRRTWPGGLPLTPAVPTTIGDLGAGLGRSLLFPVMTLALLVLPAFAFVPLRALVARITERRWSIVAASAATIVLAIGVIRVWDWSPPLLGPYLDQRGALGNDILPGDRALMLPLGAFKLLLALTGLGTVALVALLWLSAAALLADRNHNRLAELDTAALALTVVVATLIGLAIMGGGGAPLFDRYLLMAVPLAAGLALASGDRLRQGLETSVPVARAGAPPWLRWTRIVAVGLFALAGGYWTAGSAAFDAARWRAGEAAVALGYPADRVDAGFEWRNVHRPDGADSTAPAQHDANACVVVTIGGDRAGTTLGAVDLPWPWTRQGALLLVPHPDRPDCTFRP